MSEQSERDESLGGSEEASNCAIGQMYAKLTICDNAYSSKT